MTLATGANEKLVAGQAGATAGVTVGHDKGSEKYTLNVQNTTDNSERLRIIHNSSVMPVLGGQLRTYTHLD